MDHAESLGPVVRRQVTDLFGGHATGVGFLIRDLGVALEVQIAVAEG